MLQLSTRSPSRLKTRKESFSSLAFSILLSLSVFSFVNYHKFARAIDLIAWRIRIKRTDCRKLVESPTKSFLTSPSLSLFLSVFLVNHPPILPTLSATVFSFSVCYIPPPFLSRLSWFYSRPLPSSSFLARRYREYSKSYEVWIKRPQRIENTLTKMLFSFDHRLAESGTPRNCCILHVP